MPTKTFFDQFGNKFKEPVPGKDARWLGYCYYCDDSTSCVSLGGFCNGGIQYCCECGNGRILVGLKEDDLRSTILSSFLHWSKYSILPLDWYKLPEKEKWKYLKKIK